MTDVANVSWPDGMRVDRATFKKGWTQIRDELGLGFITFDGNGKISAGAGCNSCYSDGPNDPKAYDEQLMKFTGLFYMPDISLVLYKGQLIFGFGCMFPVATTLILQHYRTDGGTLPESSGHTLSLPDDKADDFKRAVEHYEAGLRKPLTFPLRMSDLVDTENPLYHRWENCPDEDYWLELCEEIRIGYQTGKAAVEDQYGLQHEFDNNQGTWDVE